MNFRENATSSSNLFGWLAIFISLFHFTIAVVESYMSRRTNCFSNWNTFSRLPPFFKKKNLDRIGAFSEIIATFIKHAITLHLQKDHFTTTKGRKKKDISSGKVMLHHSIFQTSLKTSWSPARFLLSKEFYITTVFSGYPSVNLYTDSLSSSVKPWKGLI